MAEQSDASNGLYHKLVCASRGVDEKLFPDGAGGHWPVSIVKAILDTSYDGYLGQEFIPVREPIASLTQGYRI